MDTNKIKRFATEARNILKTGIAAKIMTLGFDRKGNVAEEHRPQLMQGGTLWNGQFYTEGFYHQWMSLFNRVQQKGINEVYEEAAYTWFNRLCAIRILQKNNLCSPVLQYADAARTPVIVDQARQGHLPPMKEDLRQRVIELLDDDTKVTEQFALLITAWCHDNPIINQCFGSMADYTELLLPNNILTEGGFVDMLNHTEFITDEDFQSPELIGWLYQFYISERKDEVFAKKGKFEADEIPAATQIFTPNWIVKYMVQNTVGRIYLDNNPYETALQKKWQYLVELSEKTPAENILRYEELTDLKIADLACGSGHILNECFDLLYDLYIAEGYGRGEAIENIFQHNLTGVDIDNRAKQLATFALLLKACQKDASFADAHCLPHVLGIPKPINMTTEELSAACLDFVGGYEDVAAEWLEGYMELMKDADSLGSIMNFDLDDDEFAFFQSRYDEWAQDGENADDIPENVKQLMPAVKLMLALSTRYHALVMNPPYMGAGSMNEVLSKYVKKNYEEGKADLFSTFMMLSIDRLVANGKYGMINMQSWMFLSSFEKLRNTLLNNYHIENMLHLGPRTFDELSGEVVQNTAFVIAKHKSDESGVYFRLVDGKNCTDKKDMFLRALREHTSKVYYSNVSQSNFKKIPGCPIGYWVSKNIIKCFNNNSIKDYTISDGQNITANNNKYLRMHWEVDKNKITTNTKWKPYAKGGIFRKWYGNMEYVIDWSDEARTFYHNNSSARIIPQYLWNKKGITWTLLSSNQTGFRLLPLGATFDKTGSSIFCKHEEDIVYIMSLLNSKLSNYFLKIFSSTMAFKIVEIQRIPLIKYYINYSLPQKNISISKQDWDSHEISWDFETNPLLAVDEKTYIDNTNYEIEQHEKETGERICIDSAAPELGSLQWRVEQYKKKWERMFNQLHENEEELNRQFIEIYGLQDELTPDVPLDEITILQAGEISIEEE